MFRMFRGDKDKDNAKDDKDNTRKESRKDKEGEGGLLKGISNRFGGSNDTNTENLEDDKPEELIDTRPTFVQFQRTSSKQVLPKTGTRSTPSNIVNKSTKSAARSSSYKTPPTTPPIGGKSKSSSSSTSNRTSGNTPEKKKTKKPTSNTKPKTASSSSLEKNKKPPKPSRPSKTRRILQKVKRKDDATSDGSDGDKQESDGVLGRVQRFFGNNSNSNKDGLEADDESKKKLKSRTPRSVAQKFVANMFQNENEPKEQWIPVCPKTRLSPGEIVPVVVAGLDLIVVASKDAQNIYCMVNSCPHLGTPLETGFLERRPMEQTINQNEGGGGASAVPLEESDVAALLASDGCEDCIVCPLHKTAFALQSGQVRGEWCPYPPVLGKMMSTVKNSSSAAVFDVRTRGKNIEVRLNTPLQQLPEDAGKEGNSF